MKTIWIKIRTLARTKPKRFAAVCGILLLMVIWLWPEPAETETTKYYTVQRGDFLVSIVEGGTLEAVNEVVVRNEIEGTSRIIYIVPEGTYVNKGDVLVRLDAGDLEDKLNQEQITYAKSVASYIQATNNLAIQRSENESEVRTAELAVEFAEMDLTKYREDQMQQELRDADIEIITARESLELAKEKLQWSSELEKQGFETKNTLDQHRLSVTNQSLSLEQATNRLFMLKKYDQKKQLKQFQEDLAEAIKQLERVKKEGESKLAQAMANVDAELNTLLLNSNKLEKTKRQMDATTIEAPQAGLVVYATGNSRFSNESMIEEGATVRNRQELIKLPDTSQMKVEIKVHESHINQVNKDQLAYVVLDSMPDVRFEGKVRKVALLPDSQQRWMNPNLKVYSTEILITDKLPDIKPGVSARAEIVITNLEDVLTVPIQCVTSVKGRQVCYLENGGEPKPVPVEVGMFNNESIEIKSGLQEGDRVLLAPPLGSTASDLAGSIVESEDLPESSGPAPAPTESSAPEESTRAPSGPPSGGPDAERGPRMAAQGPEGGGPGTPDRGGFGRGGDEGPGGRGADRRQEMMARFDKDGDGVLSDSEREAMRESFGANQRRGGGFDREAIMKQFDKNGDGELDESEREAMRQQFQNRRQSP